MAKNKKKRSLGKRIFRGTFKGIGILLLVIIAALLIIPYFFKDELSEIAKEQLNQNVNATVDYGDFDLSIISSFPNFTFKINDLVVTGKDEFEGDTLASIEETKLSINLMSLISGDIKINTVGIIKPYVHVIVTDSGIANYDIALPDTSANLDTIVETAEDTGSSAFSLAIEKLYIEDAHIIYDDRQGAQYAKIEDLDFELSGDLSENIVELNTLTTIQDVKYSMGMVPMVNHWKTKMDINLKLDQTENIKIELLENQIDLNELSMELHGGVEITDSTYDLDSLTFVSKSTDLRNILSLIPAIYAREFESIKTKGQVALNAYAHGMGDFEATYYPGFRTNLSVDNGYFKYPDLPNAVENINIRTLVSHPGGNLDKMQVDVSKFHVELANNPVDADLKLSTPISNPNFKTNIKANIDLQKLKTVIPMEEGEEYNGIIDADVHIAARQSDIDNEAYEKITAQGKLNIQDMAYKSKNIPYPIQINKLNTVVSPQFVDLSESDFKVGNSDMQVNGKVDNMLEHYFNDETLVGDFKVTGNLIDLDNLMLLAGEEEVAASAESSTPSAEDVSSSASSEESYGVIRIPAVYDFNLDTDIKQVKYGKLTIKDMKGNVKIKEQVASLNEVEMKAFGGNIIANGSYNTKPKNPKVDFTYRLKDLNIRETSDYFNTIEKFAPIVKKLDGIFSSGLNFKTDLNENMTPIYSTLFAQGDLTSDDVKMTGVKVAQKLSNALNIGDMSDSKLQDIDIDFVIQNGKAQFKPFNINMGGIPMQVDGSTSIDETIDFDLKMDVPTSMLGDLIPSQLKSVVGDKIPVKANIVGNIFDPKINTDLKSALGDAKGQVVDAVKDSANKVINKNVNEQIDKLMSEANATANKIREEGKSAADKVREEGKKQAADAKKIAYEEAAKLEKKGANFLEKTANKKLAQEARKAADKTEAKALEKVEANAKKIENEAEKKAQQTLDIANQKAEQLRREE